MVAHTHTRNIEIILKRNSVLGAERACVHHAHTSETQLSVTSTANVHTCFPATEMNS